MWRRCVAAGSGKAMLSSKREISAGSRSCQREAADQNCGALRKSRLASRGTADHVSPVCRSVCVYLWPVGRGDEDGGLVALEAIELAQQHGERAARRLVHSRIITGRGERVDLVEKDDGRPL
eukprot:6271101-Prymnesium_polylepis.2